MSKRNYGEGGARPKAVHKDGVHSSPQSGAQPKPGFESGHGTPEHGARRKATASKGYHSAPAAGPRKRVR